MNSSPLPSASPLRWRGVSRRTFLKGLVATAAGVLIPGDVLAMPERRIWALDSTMVGQGARAKREVLDEASFHNYVQQFDYAFKGNELIWVESIESDHLIVRRGMGGTNPAVAGKQAVLKLEGETRLSRYDFVRFHNERLEPLGINGPNVGLGEDISTELLKRMP